MEKEFTRYKILEWNINQASNHNKNNILPEIIIKELRAQNPDIIVLTEFCFCDNASSFLERAFLQRNYDFYPTEATENTENGQNEVMIAWRKDIFNFDINNSKSEITTKNNNKPNYVRVLLTDKFTGKNILVAGVRITMANKIPQGSDKEAQNKAYQEQASLRRAQMEYVYSTLDDHPVVVIAGDFNNYRRGTCLTDWNINEITCGRKEYNRYTPTGQSIYEYESKDIDHEFAEDHFITKGCMIRDFLYDRRFINWEKNIYSEDMDLSNWRGLIGFPDHSIIYGDIYLSTD